MRFKPQIIFLLLVLLPAGTVAAQVTRILIPAGTPEDQAIQEISKETDADKRLPQLQDFVQKFAANPAAVAYGNAQISQYYLAKGDAAQALAYGDQALAAMLGDLEILLSQANAAQQLKDYQKLVSYAARGGAAVNGVGKQPKPEGLSDQDFQAMLEQERKGYQSTYEYLEGVAVNAIASETDGKRKMAEIEQFESGFPKSRFQEQISQQAILALQQMNDVERLAAYGEKALAANPDNVGVLTLLATGLVEDPKGTHLARGVDYARKAVTLAKADAPGADRARKTWAGLAHSALGFALMKQEKTLAAIPELKTASALLQEDPAAQATVLYRLGFAYAKLKRYAQARDTLNKAVKIEGPFQQASRELLAKVDAASKR